MKTITISTNKREQMLLITDQIQSYVDQKRFRNGIIFLSIPHTTAAITINENADPDVPRDILLSMQQMVQELAGFRHVEGNSTAHVKSSLIGTQLPLQVVNGKIVLGVWQGVWFCEFDGPRNRQLHIQLCELGFID